MIDAWIDNLAKVWEISDGRGGTVRSYRIFERNEFPDEVPLDRPVALTFVDAVDLSVTAGGPNLAFWHGSTIFHLTPDLSRSRMPYILPYFERIVLAAAANMQLGGAVEYFALEETNSIAITMLQYGTEARHLGLEVRWLVKERISGVTVGTG